MEVLSLLKSVLEGRTRCPSMLVSRLCFMAGGSICSCNEFEKCLWDGLGESGILLNITVDISFGRLSNSTAPLMEFVEVKGGKGSSSKS